MEEMEVAPWWIGKFFHTVWDGLRGHGVGFDDDRSLLLIEADDGRTYAVPICATWQPGGKRPDFGVMARCFAGQPLCSEPVGLTLQLTPRPADWKTGEARWRIPFTEDGYIMPPDEFARLVAETWEYYARTPAEEINDKNWRGWLTNYPKPEPETRAIAKERKGDDRPGHVYVLRCETGLHKIGRTNCVDRRLTQLGIQIPYAVELIHHFPADNMFAAESFIHKRLQHARTKGEWFRLSSEEIDWLMGIKGWRSNVIRRG